jgi:hypothetical protein
MYFFTSTLCNGAHLTASFQCFIDRYLIYRKMQEIKYHEMNDENPLTVTIP